MGHLSLRPDPPLVTLHIPLNPRLVGSGTQELLEKLAMELPGRQGTSAGRVEGEDA